MLLNRFTTVGSGLRVEMRQLPRGYDMNMPVIESKTFGVLQEVKQLGLAASEFLDAVDPKRIVPNQAGSVR